VGLREVFPSGSGRDCLGQAGTPRPASLKAHDVRRLKAERVSHPEIARRLEIVRTSLRGMMASG
jgi:hypothetical protein